MINYYVYISTIAILVLAVVWKRGDWPNTIIKCVFHLLGIFGGVVSYQLLTAP